MSVPSPLLELREVGWEAEERRILGPLTEMVREGRCTTVIGPNGSGKTTLLRLAAGLLRPASGSVLWRGRELGALPRREVARSIAYVPQVRPSRIPLTVEQMVSLGRFAYLSPWQMGLGPRDLAAVGAALEEAGVEGLRQRRVDTLSGGERQVVFIAAALAQEAELLILDEPTTHLDARHAREVAALLLRLRRDGRRTLLVATHDLNATLRLADRVLALREGSLADAGPPERLLAGEALTRLFQVPFLEVGAGERRLIYPDPGAAP